MVAKSGGDNGGISLVSTCLERLGSRQEYFPHSQEVLEEIGNLPGER